VVAIIRTRRWRDLRQDPWPGCISGVLRDMVVRACPLGAGRAYAPVTGLLMISGANSPAPLGKHGCARGPAWFIDSQHRHEGAPT
jgi:hypothetical protein